MNGSMGERLAWARNQQELILQQVSERSGLAIGYISQLEKGAKNNPTIDALQRLARALNVSVAFLMGEVPGPSQDDRGAMLLSSQAWTIGQRFSQVYAGFSKAEKERLTFESTEGLFGLVVDFLCREFPDRFTRPVVAYQLGLSVRALNDILERQCAVTPILLAQVSSITGIPTAFFYKGQLDSTTFVASPAQLLQYAEVVAMAAEAQISPEQLIKLIREFRSSR